MTERERLIPYSDDVRIINPRTGNPISPEGEEVEITPMIERRMREGLLVPESPLEASDAGGDKEPTSEIDPEAVAELEAKTKTELVSLAKDNGLEPPAGASKADLVEFLADNLTRDEG